MIKWQILMGDTIMTQEHLEWIHNYIKEIYQMPILENFLGLQIIEITEEKIPA
jgi:predicted regulator of amino acid metabolism with ACT domain